MKKRRMTIHEFKNSNRSYNIVLDNAGLYPETLQNIKCFIKKFAVGQEIFLGHYRIDGFHLSKNEMSKYSLEISKYYKYFGEYCQIEKNHNKNELAACHVPNDSNFYEIIDKIFHYYLETILFCPKISWNVFLHSYKDYMKFGVKDYILNGYTDILFSYVDSGDFSISFNSEIYDPQVMREQFNRLMSE